MRKDNDILSMYNDIDNMLNNIDVKNASDVDENTDESVVYIGEDDIIEVDSEEDLETSSSMPAMIEKDDAIEISDDEDMQLKDKEANNEEVIVEDDSEQKSADVTPISTDNETEEDKSKKDKKKKNNPQKERKTSKVAIGIFAFLDIVAITCLFLMYGPISYFRNLWVTSAMGTMSHQYFADIFFSKDSIKKILSNNVVIESGNNTNQDDIDFSGEDTGVYSSIYEEEVLKRDPDNDLYKVIDIEGNGYKGHLLVVYDASRVTLVQAPNIKYGGRQLPRLVEESGAIAGINASGFKNTDHGYVPNGIIIMNNEIVWDSGDTERIIGFTNDNVLVLTRATAKEALNMGIRDSMSFGPFLIVNGEPSEFKGNGGYGIAPRTAIGQRKDGIVLLLVIDGRRPGHSLGVDMVELTNILLKYGAYNASNLDGGGSSSMVVNGELLSVAGGFGYSGERYIPNGWLVK